MSGLILQYLLFYTLVPIPSGSIIMFSIWLFVYFFILKLYASILQDYLKFEKSSGDPTRVQILYERAITDFPVSSDLWLDYASYLDRTLKVFLF